MIISPDLWSAILTLELSKVHLCITFRGANSLRHMVLLTYSYDLCHVVDHVKLKIVTND